MAETHYALAIIGGGPAGYTAAIRASQLGFKTAIIEKSKGLGGTCLNVGCIPSKALLSSTEYLDFARTHFPKHGISAGELKVDLSALMKRKEQVVSQLTKGIDFLMKKNKVDRFQGTGRLVDAHTIEIVDGGQTSVIRADFILLATGSAPVELPFLKFDGKKIISSDQAIALPAVPKTLAIIGAGAIGLELGSVWRRLGSEVTLIEFLPRIAAGADVEVSNALKKSLEKQGLKFHLNTKVQSAVVNEKGVALSAVSGDQTITIESEIVLVSVGRRPYTDGLGLANAGLAVNDKGRIPVNEHRQTAVPHIYAVGDVVDGPMLAHKAEDEGIAAVERMAGKPGHVNYAVIPNVIYTAPEVAGVGLTEEQCKEQGLQYKVGTSPFQANGRALAADLTEGFVKILADAKTDRVLGVHIIAANASELIASSGVLMEFGGSAEDLARTVHAHPTMSEVVKEAAYAVRGQGLHQ